MAVGDIVASWGSRLDFAGEWSTSGASLLQRFEAMSGTGTTRTLTDSADAAKTWTLRNATASTVALSAGRWGNNLALNRSTPATEQTSLTVPNFTGMWPASGKMLFSVWARLSLAMTYTPIISSRNDAARKPLVYLSAMSDGRPRAMIYDAAGTAILDQIEPAASIGWTLTANDWLCYLWAVDLTAKTSQIALVRRDTGQSYVGPVRTFTGTPNAACTADFEVGTLSPTAAYWAGGFVDEVGYWKPASVDMTALVASIVHSLPARGTDSATTGLNVADSGVTATAAATLLTGSQPAAWTHQPDVATVPALASAPSALLSTDNGTTWSTATTPASLPASFTGLVRWQVPMAAGETLTTIKLVERAIPPTLNAQTLTVTQTGTVSTPLTGTWQGTPHFTAQAPTGVQVTIAGTTMTVQAGWAIGDFPISVTVTDSTTLSSSATFTLRVTAPEVELPPNPVYARAPLILYDSTDSRAVVVVDPVKAVVTTELNGAHTLKFTLPEGHKARPEVAVERIVEAAGELYRSRKITSYRNGHTPMIDVETEARFYDLRSAGQLDAAAYTGVQAGTVIAEALTDTGWTVGKVNVTTSRTWSPTAQSPLARLRQVAQVHGGDLTFDNTAKTVSLLTFAGKDVGLTFTYGRGVTGAKRVEDTTTLANRIYARNADGMTIAAVNGGIPYLEDLTWTSEIRSAVYDFASGTNPYTMLAMTTAALGKRARPAYSYDVDVIDLSAWSSQDLDRFTVGDQVTVVDADLDIDVTTRIVALDYDLLRPWASKITLSEKLRELGDSSGTDAGVLTTGTDIDTRDMVPFNLLLNARFDNGLAHWAASGATVVADGVTGPNAVELAGGGLRWIEQTVAPDTRDVYTLSFQMDATGWPEGLTPELVVLAEITYDDATTEIIEQKVT